MPKNQGVDTFPDPVGHLGPPGGHFGYCRRCGVAGDERAPPSPLGWYSLYSLNSTENVVYRAVVRRHDTSTVDCYTGLTGDRFKVRFNKHQSDIRLGKNTASKLSHHVCKLKEQNIPHDISWNIIARAPSFNPTTKVCRLCLTEAYHIMFTSGGANLNKRDELFGFCKHKWKKLLWKRRKGS